MRLMGAKIRLAYLVTHPIQYQAPLLRLLAAEPDLDLTVFFCSDFSLQSYLDVEFGQVIDWDVPLLEGYRHEFLPALGGKDRVTFWRPFNYGLSRRLKEGNFQVLWIHGYARWFHWTAMVSAKAAGVKVLMRDEATLNSAARSLGKRAAKQGFFVVLNKLVDGFLAIGGANADYYRHHGVPGEKIFLVPYAVDNAFFQKKAREASAQAAVLRRSLGLENGRPVILFVGKLSERKRAGDLLEAYIRLSPGEGAEPFPYLLFVGEGEMRGPLERRAAETSWDSIKFLGFKNQTELPAYYHLCQIFVLPSAFEPWGLVVNEAMNAGRAVIVSDQSGCGPDLVRNGENGYIFRTGDIHGLGRVLGDILQARKWAQMGRRSLELINGWSFAEDVAGLKEALNYVCR